MIATQPINHQENITADLNTVIGANGETIALVPNPEPAPSSKKTKTAKRWSVQENQLLKAAVAIYGEKNWKTIAQFVPGRNHTQCLQR
jgi:myb proto-oncogene protein